MKLVIHARIISYTNLSSTINEAGSLGVIGDGVISREGEVIRLLHDHWHQQPLAISGTKERVVPPPPKTCHDKDREEECHLHLHLTP